MGSHPVKITSHVLMLTFGRSGFPTCTARFQIAAPEGFSARLTRPAHTIPGSLAVVAKLTRFHHCFLEQISANYAINGWISQSENKEKETGVIAGFSVIYHYICLDVYPVR
jgi:hypothetical protein